jgi:hypothetical protein
MRSPPARPEPCSTTPPSAHTGHGSSPASQETARRATPSKPAITSSTYARDTAGGGLTLRLSYATRATQAETSSSSSETTCRPSPLTTPPLRSLDTFCIPQTRLKTLLRTRHQMHSCPQSGITVLSQLRAETRCMYLYCLPGRDRDPNTIDLRRRVESRTGQNALGPIRAKSLILVDLDSNTNSRKCQIFENDCSFMGKTNS